MGCGRVGAQLAATLDADGYAVTSLDNDAYSFRRLPSTFSGSALLGNGIDEVALKRAALRKRMSFSPLLREITVILWQHKLPSIFLMLSA